MAPESSVNWTESAFRRYQELPYKVRELINEKLALLVSHPQMYQIESQGRWEGLRRMVIGNIKPYYTYWHPEDTIYIEFIS